MSERTHFFIYLLAFQAFWLACICYGSVGQGWPLVILALVAASIHFQFAEGWGAALPLVLSVMLGVVSDQLAYVIGWISFPHHVGNKAFIPLWMAALWLGFSTSLNVNFAWLRQYPRVAVLFGLLGGPAAYWGAQGLGAVVLTHPWWSSVWVGVSWGILMPLLLWLRRPHSGL